MIVNRIEKLTARLSLTLLASIGMLVGSNSESLGQNETIIQSTKLVPMDADFYYGSYKLREQWDRFVAGPVTRELMSLPALEDALSRFRTEWRERKGLGATARTMLDNGNVKDILAFIQELLSSDVFVFGDKKMSIWSETMAKVSDEISQMMFSSEATTDEIGPMITNKWIGAIKEMTVPTLVIGARCNNIDLALSKIDQLEIPLFGLKQIPSAAPFFANLNRIDDNRGDRLQWTLKGSQIPWDLIPTNETFDEDLKDSLSEALDEKSVTITIGMFDGNFVVAISSTPETLMALGKNKSLMEHPDMQPARDLLSRPIAGISYVSDALAKANFNATYNNFFSRNATTNVFQVQQLLAEDSEFRDFLEDLVNDFKTVDELIAKVIPEFKGATSVSFLTDEGWERHDHFRTKDVISDSSSRLVSLEHVGSDPILMVATKVQDHPEYFQLARKVVQISKARFDEAITMDWSEVGVNTDMARVDEYAEKVWPFVVRLADLWEKKFLPSMTGEHAVVMSGGNLSAKQWFKDMPPSSEPLPLPELGIVIGLKNKDLFLSGCKDMFQWFDDLVDAIRKEHPNDVPADYKVPRPVESKTVEGVKYGYPIPADCPVPVEMMPQALISGDFLIETYSDKQSALLANKNKLVIGQGVIDPNAQQSNVSYVNVGKLFALARPWIRYGMTQSIEDMDEAIFSDVLPQEYAEYDVTGSEIFAAWNVLCKIGSISSCSASDPNGGTFVRSVYRSQRAK